MADDRYRQDYPQHNRVEDTRSHPHPSSDASRPNMAASVTLPSIHDSRAQTYQQQQPPPSRGYGADPRYASPNAVNGYPPPHGQQQGPNSYLPPLQPQQDSRQPGYAPQDQRGGYYDDRRPPSQYHDQYHDQYPPETYYYRGPPQGPPGPGYGRDYRGPPPGYEYAQMANPPPGMAQAAPRQRTSIACRYCRKRKIRCSGYQSAPGGKCQNCARMNQECIFQPVSSSSSTAFIPVSAVPGGVPPGTQLFGAYGQPLPNAAPGPHHPYPPAAGPPPPNYYAPMQSPTESYASYGDPRGDDGQGRRRRRLSDEQEEPYRLPPPRGGGQEEERNRRSPAESNHSSPNGPGYTAQQGAKQSPHNQASAQPTSSYASSGPGGRSPTAQHESSGSSTPAKSSSAPTSQPQKTSVMSLSNLVDKSDIDKTMIDRLNRPRDK